MNDIIIRAAQFAEQAHRGQTRKYTGRPYITHPIRVAGRVATHSLATPDLVAAAFLHDVVEDCGTRPEILAIIFNRAVHNIVMQLTNLPRMEGESRKKHKLREIDRMSIAPQEVKLIKLIDRTDNLNEIDPTKKFAKPYAQESLDLLEGALVFTDHNLEKEMLAVIQKILKGTE